ncbi:MAG TPA: tRNA pseudouridine(55) synthase TruB [Gammaproteobacteria bacterium]
MGARRGRNVRGILLLDKPSGLTSNQALQRAKRLFQAAKAGHTGSLDPLATGMLPICFGAATKLAGYLLDARKTYAVTAKLGIATDTGDADGEVIATSDTAPPGELEVRDAVRSFVGEIEQTPPMYSALKRDGKRLYELARQGIVVDREPRRVRIDAIDLDEYAWPVLRFTMTCSKGTYVRTLVTDLAEKLGTLGHVIALRRLAVEPFDPADMLGFEQLERDASQGVAALDRRLLPAERALMAWPRLELPPPSTERLLRGQSIPAAADWPVGFVRIADRNMGFVGIGEVLPEGRLAPRRMLLG